MSPTDTENADYVVPDFVLDPSDPLYMLLNSTHDAKSGAPFDFSFPMDLDINDPSFSVFVDPNALFIDGKESVHSAPPVPLQPQDLLNPSFQFSFSSPTLSSASASPDESPPGLSPSSPSSSTRASPPAPAVQKSTADAVPAFFPQSNLPLMAALQSQLAAQQPVHPAPPAHISQGPQTHVINTVATGRPKTSHTTIERRYRTNLNARIQSLKTAVPALRVLDQNCKNDEYKVDDRGYIDGVKVARKGSKANVLGKAVEYIYVLKRREARLKREQDGLRTLICKFSDGQNILAEWEAEWTKKFGGPEKDEIDNAGMEDASDDEDGDGEDDGDTPERIRKKPKIEALKKEKRKIAPAAPAPALLPSEALVAVPGVIEKRKRGRPRKIQPNVTPAISPAVSPPGLLAQPSVVVSPTMAQVAQPQQYLLAVFALFSFFNSPLTSTSRPVSHHNTHQGSVLSHTSRLPFQPSTGWMWNDVVQFIHLLASLAVFISIVIPWIPVPQRVYRSRLMQLMPFASLVYHGHVNPRDMADLPTPPESPHVSDDGSEPESSSTEFTVRASEESSDPLSCTLRSRGAVDEFDHLLKVLNISTGWIGVVRGTAGVLQSPSKLETRREQRAWTRLAELVVMAPEKTSMLVRWQVYNHLSRRLASTEMELGSETLVIHLCTLALLAQPLPFARAQSQARWTRAGELAESVDVAAYHRLVFGSLTIEEAMECLTTSKPVPGSSPIALLASVLLRKRLRSHASALFIHRVCEGQDGGSEIPSNEDPKTWSATLSYGRTLGSDIGLLCDAFAKVWQDRWFCLDINDLKVEAVNEDVLALLRAIALYNQVFVSQSIWSPPPSPSVNRSGEEGDVVLLLRRVLGSNVFEESRESNSGGFSLEDARDRVVDMIVNLQKERRTRVG